jgi:hypothetical protein
MQSPAPAGRYITGSRSGSSSSNVVINPHQTSTDEPQKGSRVCGDRAQSCSNECGQVSSPPSAHSS